MKNLAIAQIVVIALAFFYGFFGGVDDTVYTVLGLVMIVTNIWLPVLILKK
jgi:hypothetical protein